MKRLLSILCAAALTLGTLLTVITLPDGGQTTARAAEVCTCDEGCLCRGDYTFGDVNADGRIDTTDARLTLQYAAKRVDKTALNLLAADVNSSGGVDTTDARLILQYAAKRIKDFPDAQYPPCDENCPVCFGTLQGTRNIALNRAVYQSSSSNSNNTGHLVTNGISKTAEDAGNPSVTSQYHDSPSGEGADYAFDGQTATKFFSYRSAWVEYRFADGEAKTVTQYAITTANDMIGCHVEIDTIKRLRKGVCKRLIFGCIL